MDSRHPQRRFKPPALLKENISVNALHQNTLPKPAASRVVQPLAPCHVSAPQQPPQPDNAPSVSYFRVLYTKYAPQKKRKNKTFADGVLEIKGGACTLYTQEGKVSSRGKLIYKGHLEPGIELVIGTHEMELDTPIPADEFAAGSCFMTDTAAAPTMGAAAALPQQRSVVGFKRVRPGGSGAAVKVQATVPRPLYSVDDPDALVLNQAQVDADPTITPVLVDPLLRRHLRPHQREGVAFLYRCVMGMQGTNTQGCILADDMGLGKTLQILTLLWTLLKQGPKGKPVARRCVVVCPSSLTRNWEEEARKWLGVERLCCLVVQPRKDASTAQQINEFKHGAVYQLLILSYESARQHAPILRGSCDVLVCDEGHRLKAAGGNKTMNALLALDCKRRIILSGSPVQNNLGEFFAMINFVAPGLLPENATFRQLFETPITQAQERGATLVQCMLGAARAEELKRRVGAIVLRRTADINLKFLPPCTTTVVWCRPAPLQLAVYRTLLRSKQVGDLLCGVEQGADATLAAIMQLRKLCNHPRLLQDVLDEVGGNAHEEDAAAGSGKLVVLVHLLTRIIASGERVVVVSTSTQALNIVATICNQHAWSTVRIDGATDATRRQDIVTAFNRCNVGQVFLLSTRAGGAGLNLIGASRLIMVDFDWNPACDLQAMARIWRDGQTRPCTVYRLLLTGTLDEKIYQRQLLKGTLADTMIRGGGVVVGGKNGTHDSKGPRFTKDELRELFTLDETTCCGTRDLLQATGAEAWEDERDSLAEEDPLFQAVQEGLVTWVRSSVTSAADMTTPASPTPAAAEENNDPEQPNNDDADASMLLEDVLLYDDVYQT